MHDPGPITNALTIDVEDYFQVSAFAPYIKRSEWDSRECRVERNVDRILALLDDRGVRATFFTLGWIAERYPAMVRRIVDGGHELASHGYGHERASDLSETDFFNDVHRAKALLEDIGGMLVLGYRAPSFSIGSANMWALDTLLRAGYRYSSSIYPIRHDHYGMPFYFHPWEIDVRQPRIQGIGFKTRFRHYVNIGRMEKRLGLLLQDFCWGRMDHVFLPRHAPEVSLV